MSALGAVTVLGGGNTAFSVAASLALRGFEITLYELPEFAASLAPIDRSRTINLVGVGGEGAAKIHRITTDIEEALSASDLALVIVPAYGHQRFAEVCAPHLRSDHLVVLMPGTLGTLQWAKVLREADAAGVTLAEVDTAPYICRKTSPDTARIWGVVARLGLGVLPSTRTESSRARLDPLFPGITTYPDVMACGLSAVNPVIHPAGVLMNAGRVEYSRGEFYFYEEGVSPSVAKVIMPVDKERLDIGRTLGYSLTPANEAMHQAGFGPQGDLWATINGSRMLTQLRAPGVLTNRWLTEDIPFGIATWSLLGAQYGVETSIMRSMVDIGSVVMGFSGWDEARGLDELGVLGMGREELKEFLTTGSRS